jgi:hypothetical protein
MVWILIIIILFYRLMLRHKKEVNHSSYIPNPKGHWINKGTVFDEKWEWWEPKDIHKMLYVSVHGNDNEEGYTIVVDEPSPAVGIEYTECKGQREAEIAVRLYTAYYKVLGSVTLIDRAEISLNMKGD